jgi:type IV pilus assembly protein PilC
MALCPQVFDRFYVNMIRAGEEAGILDSILNRLSIYMEKAQKLKGQVVGAMIYPAVIIFVAIIVVIVIMIFIIPKFEDLFKGSGQEPPALTKIVVAMSHGLADYWYIVLGSFIGIPWLVMTYLNTPAGKSLFDRTIMFAPILGEAVQKASIAKLTRTLSTLLGSGVNLVEAIEIAARTAGNEVIETSLLRCKEAVLSGKPFTTPLAKEKAFPPMVVQMIAIGEQSGTVDAMLGKIADFYEDEVEASLKALTSLIEPILMVVLGVVIATLVLALYLPIFNLSSTVGK